MSVLNRTFSSYLCLCICFKTSLRCKFSFELLTEFLSLLFSLCKVLYLRLYLIALPFILFKWFSGLPFPVEPTFPVIYNSLRYDDTAHVVTFHLREKDWNELKSSSWMWIASSDLIPVIKREPVFLGDETVKSIGRVNPVEKFGLFSVQTFTVAETNENCQILKVSLGLDMNPKCMAQSDLEMIVVGNHAVRVVVVVSAAAVVVVVVFVVVFVVFVCCCWATILLDFNTNRSTVQARSKIC